MNPIVFRRWAAFTFVFLLVFAATNGLAGFWLAPSLARRYAAIFDGREHFQHIILGTSHTEMGLNPRYVAPITPDFYNFAASGSTPSYYLRWYAAYRRYQPAPSLVLFGVDWFFFKDVSRRSLEQDSAFLPAPVLGDLIAHRGTDLKALVFNWFPLLSLRKDLQSRLFGDVPLRELETERFYRGFIPLKAKLYLGDSVPISPPDYPPYLADFDRLLAVMAHDHTRLIFIQMPEYLPAAGRHVAENARIRTIARAHGIPFLNFNEELRSPLNEDQPAFADWGHLNEVGSERFGPILARALSSTPGFAGLRSRGDQAAGSIGASSVGAGGR